MDTNNLNKRLFWLKMLYVNASVERLGFYFVHWEVAFRKIGVVYADNSSKRCPCTHAVEAIGLGYFYCVCVPVHAKFVYNTGGSTVNSSSIFGKLDNFAHGQIMFSILLKSPPELQSRWRRETEMDRKEWLMCLWYIVSRLNVPLHCFFPKVPAFDRSNQLVSEVRKLLDTTSSFRVAWRGCFFYVSRLFPPSIARPASSLCLCGAAE